MAAIRPERQLVPDLVALAKRHGREKDPHVRQLIARAQVNDFVHSELLARVAARTRAGLQLGKVYLQQDICNGCAYCVAACPFGVLDRNHEDGNAHKCTLCYDRQKDGLTPACAKSCATWWFATTPPPS